MAKEINGIELDRLMQTIDALKRDPDLGKSKFRAITRWLNGTRNLGTIKTYHMAKQEMEHPQTFESRADEPPMLAGSDSAPNPVEKLLTALGACLTTSLVAHAAVRGIEIEKLECRIEGDIDLNGFVGLTDAPKGYQELRVEVAVSSNEDAAKLRQLAEFPPVLNTIMSGARVDLKVEKRQAEAETSTPAQPSPPM